jgi:alpha-beta hydrolase superfamily lysophospholipase
MEDKGMTQDTEMSAHEEDIRGATGLKLHVRTWPATGTARAAVMIVPGFNSHSGYYSETASVLSRRGIDVFAIDLRGRGASDGERFYVDTFDDYVSDLRRWRRPSGHESGTCRCSCWGTAPAASWRVCMPSSTRRNSPA